MEGRQNVVANDLAVNIVAPPISNNFNKRFGSKVSINRASFVPLRFYDR